MVYLLIATLSAFELSIFFVHHILVPFEGYLNRYLFFGKGGLTEYSVGNIAYLYYILGGTVVLTPFIYIVLTEIRKRVFKNKPQPR